MYLFFTYTHKNKDSEFNVLTAEDGMNIISYDQINLEASLEEF